MKRLLRVSFDSLIYSLSSISIWFVLSVFFDKNLITVFMLTYPIQYVANVLKAIFGTGANISKEKGNKDDVLSAMTLGILFSMTIFIIIIINIDSYISFMNMNVDKTFVIYSVLVIFLETLLNFVVIKLYYENKNIIANKYTAIFYIMNFISVLITSIIFKEASYVVLPTLMCLSICTIYLVIKSYKSFQFTFHIIKWIKYNLVEISDHLFLGLAYLIGINIALDYGESYALAMTFIALITDTQWDISNSIDAVAKIDISKQQFNYKNHLRNAYKLIIILLTSILIMFIALYNFYDLKLEIVLIYLFFHIADFVTAPLCKINTVYLQLEYSTFKTTSNNLFGRILRLILSFLRTPFCTVIAQLIPQIYLAISMNIIFRKNYEIDKAGNVIRKDRRNDSSMVI